MGQICWLDHCQVQMTSCHANPDGGEEGGTQGGEAIPKQLRCSNIDQNVKLKIKKVWFC